jgi:predicted TIM-barrel fold metal-dependent hydrolase
MSGATERFSRIRFVLAHAGGLMPYFAWRLSIAPMIDARLEQLTPAQIFARLARFWYDTALSPTPQTLACLAGVARPAQVVFGTDWPFANASVIAEAMKYATAAPPDGLDRAAVDRGNALVLFPQFA